MDTFSPLVKMTSLQILVSLAATYHWPLHQLDIKNSFLNDILDGDVCMEQPPGFIAHGGEYKSLHVEEVTPQSQTVFEDLVWVFCISNSGIWTLSV